VLTVLVAGCGASAHTQTLIYTGVNVSGRPAVSISARTRGSCWEGSVAALRSDAWRCSEGNTILDPCFGSGPGSFVICPNDGPWSNATELHLTKPLPINTNTGQGTSGTPWAIELSNGAKCLLDTGATTVVDDMRLNYTCNKNVYLYGNPQRSTNSSWAIFGGAPNAAHLTPQPIATAWF
jgi:eukaryotic-like serine/threonine-protein kinase